MNRLVERLRRLASTTPWAVAELLGERTYRLADWLTQLPFDDQWPLPEPFPLGASLVDTTADLEAFTGFQRPVLERMLRHRQPLSFRSEWYATPPALRTDHWFYRSSSAYLFANAVHFTDTRLLRLVAAHVSEPATILDYGGGTGELTLRLAAQGHRVDHLEISALQREFMSFRVDHHGCEDVVKVLAPWAKLASGRYDCICAADVIEHLPDPRLVLSQQLIPALTPAGVLVENSPFSDGFDLSNPMHHDDFGFDSFMAEAGFAVVGADGGLRAWARTA